MIGTQIAKGAFALSLALTAMISPASAQEAACPAPPVNEGAFALAADAIASKEYSRALQLADTVGNETLADVVRWAALTDEDTPATFTQIQSLMQRHPTWPQQGTLRLRGEKLLPATASTADKVRWFDQAQPETFDGLMAYLDGLRQLGRNEDRAKTAVEYWQSYPMRAAQQQAFLRQHGEFLTSEGHWQRADRMVWRDDFQQAERLLPLLSSGQQALIKARIALRRSASGVDAAIKRVPQDLQANEGLLYDRLRWRQRRELTNGAVEMLSRQPTNVANPRSWWRVRMVLAREALSDGQPVQAYTLAASHRETAGVRLVEAEWLAGWVALHHLGKPGQAAEHFAAILNNSKTPISRSRGAYWLGEAWNAMGSPQDAERWWQQAAQYPTAFYGQLAGQQLGLLVPFPQAEAVPVAPASGAYLGDRGCLVLTLARLGAPDLAAPFMNALSRSASTIDEQRAVAGLSLAIGQLPTAISAGKKLINQGRWLPAATYPGLPVPESTSAIEPSIASAIIRQESVFDRTAISSAGARGLMQLMPGTADDTARSIGISVSRSDLIERPDLNVRLGSSYFKQLLNRYDGATVLAVAAYNAGPGNANRWIRRFGDPRDPQVDIRHWIESIPFSETRNYVQRVLENIIVYRRLTGQTGSEAELLSLLSGS